MLLNPQTQVTSPCTLTIVHCTFHNLRSLPLSALHTPSNPPRRHCRQDAILQVASYSSPTIGSVPTNLVSASFFKTLTQQTVTVELKNDISIRGTLKSVDQYLNIKLDDITVLDELKYPHLSSVKNIFIRGSVVRYVHLPPDKVDRGLLEDACRREAMAQRGKGA